VSHFAQLFGDRFAYIFTSGFYGLHYVTLAASAPEEIQIIENSLWLLCSSTGILSLRLNLWQHLLKSKSVCPHAWVALRA
jgi:hypothetical protein